MTIKLIAIDIDGTLLNSQHIVSNSVKQTIQTAVEAGIKIVLCTGRPTPSAMPYVKDLNLSTSDDYVITYNGAVTHRMDKQEPILQKMLSTQKVKQLFSLASQFNCHAHAITDKGIYTPSNPIGQYSIKESWLTGMDLFYQPIDQLGKHTQYNKFMMIDEASILDTVVKQLPKDITKAYTILRSEPYYLEFVHPEASKGQAVLTLAQQLNIDPTHVMGIGDSGNDLDLMSCCGIGVAMGNATDELKEKADYITDTNDKDGVAKAIQRFAL